MILIDGYYGNKNTGDDLFVTVLFSFLGKNVKFLTSEKIEGIPSECFFSKNKFRGYQKILFIILLLRHRKFLTGGGSVFEEKQKWFSFRGLALIINRIVPIKMYSVGVSLSPNNNELVKVVNEVKEFQIIYVRDLSSYNYSVNLALKNIQKGVDLAYFTKLNYSKSNNDVLTVIHCPFESVRKLDLNKEKLRDENLKKYLISIVLNENIKEIQLLEFNGHKRDGDFEKIMNIKIALSFLKIKIEIIRYSNNPDKMIQAISQSKFVISTRLHGAIISHIVGVPFILLEYHAKCTDWLDTIEYPKKFRIGDAVVSSTEFNVVYNNVKNNDSQTQINKKLKILLNEGERIKQELSSIINCNPGI